MWTDDAMYDSVREWMCGLYGSFKLLLKIKMHTWSRNKIERGSWMKMDGGNGSGA